MSGKGSPSISEGWIFSNRKRQLCSTWVELWLFPMCVLAVGQPQQVCLQQLKQLLPAPLIATARVKPCKHPGHLTLSAGNNTNRAHTRSSTFPKVVHSNHKSKLRIQFDSGFNALHDLRTRWIIEPTDSDSTSSIQEAKA